ncbi:MAG TPA: bifunctional proline dehydrogenase/L-glutamate gamma-semialdehyde dehydrogenase [Desulfuromonadales bacterium]|nr:bifunctional proline dehydrogenase/L-glutamate gamma-semialdehyde dehydrogenase [Desulfuromonadales bacterium]
MLPVELNTQIIARGTSLYAQISDEKPSLFNSSSWTGKIMAWCMQNDEFKTRMFRFVDVFPSLRTSRQLLDHLHQYFGDSNDLPLILTDGVRVARMFGTLGGTLLSKTISANIYGMAHQFIIAETVSELVRRLEDLHLDGIRTVVDVLGEATLSHEEAEQYVCTYLELLDVVSAAQQKWHPHTGIQNLNESGQEASPLINISVKPTALYCLANPMDFEGSVTGILKQLRRICERAIEGEAFLCIDMESHRFTAIILEVYRRLKQEFRDYPHIGIVLQSYLKESERDLSELLDWARKQNLQISIRLVKGAYWDYESVVAAQMGWELPVRTIKADTDAAFERMAAAILRHHHICHLACASHNIRTISAVLETARSLNVPESRYEFQMLYGMAEPVRQAILKETGRLRLYCPFGALVPGMGYLVRRLLENSANESFLRQSFSVGTDFERLLEDPAVVLERVMSEHTQQHGTEREIVRLSSFINQPMIDFSDPEQRSAFPEAIQQVRSRFGCSVPLFINGIDVHIDKTIPSINPARPSEILGHVCQADVTEVISAIKAAQAAFPLWRDTAPERRAQYLIDAAAVARRRIFELAAWEVLEIGKQWDQAYADVAEAIDFLEYYADAMIRIGADRQPGSKPGESNRLFYEARGVAVVIAPWNFPLAISTGMSAAAIVSGNPVLFKPSGLTGLIGHQLVDIFREVGLPPGVFNFIPGQGSAIGDLLVDHPAISLIVFTGSMEVGLRIIQRAAVVHPGQKQIKKVVCEMGGKNAIIIDEDADFDETIPQVLTSAFGFQGQKCSACSRLIVLDSIYDYFVKRLIQAARAWNIGPAENPAYNMGAVAEKAAMEKIRNYIEIGNQEGRLLYQSPVPQGDGYWVPLTIFGDIRPEHRLAQDEIFGPVLSIMRANDFDQALQWANESVFALTGGIFSRFPEHIKQAQREFRVGNLYINRGITGAMVGRQPFGGAALSGGGTKSGGPDYLLNFMIPRVTTENTMRRGFTPEGSSGGSK